MNNAIFLLPVIVFFGVEEGVLVLLEEVLEGDGGYVGSFVTTEVGTTALVVLLTTAEAVDVDGYFYTTGIY